MAEAGAAAGGGGAGEELRRGGDGGEEKGADARRRREWAAGAQRGLPGLAAGAVRRGRCGGATWRAPIGPGRRRRSVRTCPA